VDQDWTVDGNLGILAVNRQLQLLRQSVAIASCRAAIFVEGQQHFLEGT
jgi:hypothetical protein